MPDPFQEPVIRERLEAMLECARHTQSRIMAATSPADKMKIQYGYLLDTKIARMDLVNALRPIMEREFPGPRNGRRDGHAQPLMTKASVEGERVADRLFPRERINQLVHGFECYLQLQGTQASLPDTIDKEVDFFRRHLSEQLMEVLSSKTPLKGQSRAA